MRWKRLAVKTLVCFTFVVSAVGVIFCVGYSLRHPENNNYNSQAQQGKAQDGVSTIQVRDSSPSRETREDYQSYAAKWFEPITILTFLLVIGIVITNCIYYGQLKQMRETVVAAKWSADMATGQLVAMQHQEQAQFKALEQNQQAAKIAEKISIYANRAYVAAKIRGVSANLTQLRFRLRIENSGNTPANHVRVSYAHGLRDSPPHKETGEKFVASAEEIVVFDNGFTEHEWLGFIAPDSSYHVVDTPITFMSDLERPRWEWGELKFYCWGRIYYDTIFDEGRHTDFCFVQSNEHPTGYPCKHGNEGI